jgi:hypothetical protein
MSFGGLIMRLLLCFCRKKKFENTMRTTKEAALFLVWKKADLAWFNVFTKYTTSLIIL